MVPDVLAAIEARPPQSSSRGAVGFRWHAGVVRRRSCRAAAERRDQARTRDACVARRCHRRARQRHGAWTISTAARSCRRYVYLAGLHGLEIRHGDRAWRSSRSRRVCASWSIEVADAINRAVGGVPGVRLEHKGVSVTVHVRGGEPGSPAGRASTRAHRRARPWLESGALKVLDASEAVELLPNIAVDQGRRGALDRRRHRDARARKPAWCVFFGDDVTDEDAFRAVQRGLTVVVGQRPSLARLRSELSI